MYVECSLNIIRQSKNTKNRNLEKNFTAWSEEKRAALKPTILISVSV